MGVTLVTGASSGIGRSLARRLAAGGEAVACAARRQERLDALVAEIAAAGGRALAIACDVTQRDQVRAAVARTEAELGPIDRLVANAGGGEPMRPEDFDAVLVARVLELNVGGTAHCVEAVLPGMLARRSGHLVSMSSLAAWRGLPRAAAYCAAKAALTRLMESLRVDLRGSGVDVTLLLPGFVRVKPGPSKRRKPLQLELEDATARMERAIRARRPRAAFPWPLAAALGALNLLPSGLADRLLVGRGW